MAEASRHLQSRGVPEELSRLLSRGGQAGASFVLRGQQRLDAGSFTEDAMSTAREYLNDIFSKAWTELDDKVVECKAVDSRAQEVLTQIATDLSSLGEHSADLARRRGEASEGQAQAKEAIDRAKQEGRQQLLDYQAKQAQTHRDMLYQQDNLRVFESLLEESACDTGSSALLLQRGSAPSPRLCRGNRSVRDHLSKLSPEAQRRLGGTVRLALAAASGGGRPREQSRLRLPDDAPGDPSELEDAFCANISVQCGAISDAVAEEWGKAKDSVDELAAELARVGDDAARFNVQLQGQIATLRGVQGDCAGQLAEATAQMNQAASEARQKEEQRRDLLSSHGRFMSECSERIEQILYQDMCYIKKIRAGILENSTVSPPDDIVDCEVSDWVPGECSVSCDDACAGAQDVGACGGWQTLSREVMMQNNSYGVACPALQRSGRCGQVMCPVDCAMSEWSGFSECSKECEGGVQERTRSVISHASHSGTPCGATQEARPCNTGSCDQDCELAAWTEWSACSQACGGGYRARRRDVVAPIRGNGQCPVATSHDRVLYERCNDEGCYGDEMCVSVQDVVIAVDSSGSTSAAQFEKLQSFLDLLVSRYRPTFYGQDKARLGVLQYGNGELSDNGTITQAVEVAELTDDLDSVRTAIEGLSAQNGFTNLGQALVLAEQMLEDSSREDAESVVLVVTDGHPATLKGQAASQARELNDKGIRVFFVEVADEKGSAFAEMQGWASEPGWAGVEFLPGWSEIAIDEDAYAGRVVARFCPEFLSDTLVAEEANSTGFLLVASGAACGDPPALGDLLASGVQDAAACCALAAEANLTSFYLGRAEQAGQCFVGPVEVDAATWSGWLETDALVSPSCSASSSGEFTPNHLYDFYAINPDFEFTSAIDAELSEDSEDETSYS